MARFLFPCAVALLLAVVLVVPTVRVWRRYHVWPVVFRREADPFQRLMGGLMSGLLAAVLGWSVLVAVVGPAPLGIWGAPTALAATGWIAVGLGAVIVLVAQAHMGASWRIGIDDRRTELVTSGLFGLVRNPIFSGLLLSLLGVVLITPAAWTLAGFLLVAALIAMQVRLEEQHLRRTEGARYDDYAAKVGRFVPLLGRIRRHDGAASPETQGARGGA